MREGQPNAEESGAGVESTRRGRVVDDGDARRRQEIADHNARAIKGELEGGLYGTEQDQLRGS